MVSKKYIVVLFFIICPVLAMAQNPTYEAALVKDSMTSANSYEFSVALKRRDTTRFEMYLFQMGLLIPAKVANGGTLSFTYVTGSSQLSNTAQAPSTVNITTKIAVGTDTMIMVKVAGKIAAIGAGSVIPATQTIVGRFKLSTTAASLLTPVGVRWNFNPNLPYYGTKVQAAVGGFPIDISAPASHIYTLSQIPVELASFTSSVNKRDVMLQWSTATEKNARQFVVERRTIGKAKTSSQWVAAGTIQAAGNSTTEKQYAFTDSKLNAGSYSYRLRLVDFDGTTKYSSEVNAEISMPTVFEMSQNYPNPFNPSTKIDFQLPVDANVSIDVYNMTGKLIKTLIGNESREAGYYTVEFSAAQNQLASGVYIYRVIAKGRNGASFSKASKMVLLK